MSNFVTRTFYGNDLQTCQFLGLPYVIDPKSTLNERFDILKEQGLPDGVYPRARYLSIGLGGHRNTTGAQGIGLTTEVPYLATNASNYKPLPFVLRAVNDDLAPSQRARYAMRRIETHNAESYVAYYLRRLSMDGVSVEKTILTKNEDGSVTPTPFVPSDENLVPTPPVMTNEGVNLLLAKNGVINARVPLIMSTDEMKELQDAATIIYGDPAYAIISEMTLCTGVDRVIQLSDGSNFNEAICVQSAAFVNTLHQARFTNDGIDSAINVGVSEPLLKIAQN